MSEMQLHQALHRSKDSSRSKGKLISRSSAYKEQFPFNEESTSLTNRKAASKTLDLQLAGLVKEEIQRQRALSVVRTRDLDDEKQRTSDYRRNPKYSANREQFPLYDELAPRGSTKVASKVIDLQLVGLVQEELQRRRVSSTVQSHHQDEDTDLRISCTSAPERYAALPEYFPDGRASSNQVAGGKIVNWFTNSPDDSDRDEVVPIWILHPESRGKVGWDIFTGAQVIIVCFLLPFEICFMDSQGISPPYWWGVMDIVMTACFMLDIFVNFCTAYRERVHSPIIDDLRLIARKYAKTWMLTDVIAAFPFFLFDPSSPGHRGNKLNLSKLGRFTRFMRLVRLARLLRLLKLPRLFLLIQNLERKANLHPGLSRMGRIMASVVFGVHFAACIWFVLGRTIRYCDFPDPWPVATLEDQDCSWISYFGYVHGFHSNQTFSLDRQYIASFYFSMTTLATVGYGDISGKTYAEQIFAMMLMIFGVVWYSFVLSSTASIINSFQGSEEKLHQRLRETNLFIREAKLPNELAQKMRKHFRAVASKQNALTSYQDYDTHEIISNLSNDLKAEVIIWIQRHVIESIPFLNDSDDVIFQAALVVRLTPLMFSANEHIFKEGDLFEKILFIVTGSGISTIGGTYFRVFQQGAQLGLSGVLARGVQKISVYALINCHTECLPVNDFLHLSNFYNAHLSKLWEEAHAELDAVETFLNASSDQRKGLRGQLRKQQGKVNWEQRKSSTGPTKTGSSYCPFTTKSLSSLLETGLGLSIKRRLDLSRTSGHTVATDVDSVARPPLQRRRSSHGFTKHQSDRMLGRAESQSGVLFELDGAEISKHSRRNSFSGLVKAQSVPGRNTGNTRKRRASTGSAGHGTLQILAESNLRYSSGSVQKTNFKSIKAKDINYKVPHYLSGLMQQMIDQKIQSLVNIATKNVQAVCSK